METIYIIDSKLYAYSEIQRKASITNIFNTITNDLLLMKKKGKIFIVFDVGKSDYREAEQSYYKAHRREAQSKKSDAEKEAYRVFNEDYIKLIDLFKHLNVTVAAVNGVEADDLASIIALRHKDDNVILLSADRDWLHSVVGTERCIMYAGREQKLFIHEDVVETYGVETRREFSILKSIQGDDGDNLLSLKNVGPVKARQIFKDIKDIYGEPTDEQIITYLESYVADNSRIAIHDKHIEAGRTTIADMFTSNMKVAETFTSLTNLDRSQMKQYLNCMDVRPAPSEELFTEKCIELFGFPIFLTDNSRKVLL